MSVLATVKAQLGYYADMLEWTQTKGIVKAVPKRKLSRLSHKIIRKAFERFGGGFVSNGGSHYFELVLKPRQLSPNGEIALAYHMLMKEGVFE